MQQLPSKYPKSDKVPDGLYKIAEAYRALHDKVSARAYCNRVLEQYPKSEAAAQATKLLEALAAGVRIAALPAEGPTSWQDNQWSLADIAASQSPDAYAHSLRRALAPSSITDVERARAMARRYAWTEIVPRIRRVYADAIAAHDRRKEPRSSLSK